MTAPSAPQLSAYLHILALALGLIVLTELVGCVAVMVGPRVYTEEDATYVEALGQGYGYVDDDAMKIKPHPVRIVADGRAAELKMRCYRANGRVFEIIGDATLRSADGKYAWSHRFEGFGEDLGPAIFAVAFTDVDGDGVCEAICRHLETKHETDLEDGNSSVTRRLLPPQVERLDGRPMPDIPEFRTRCDIALAFARVTLPLLGFMQGMGVMMILLIPPIALGMVLLVLLERGRSIASPDGMPVSAQQSSLPSQSSSPPVGPAAQCSPAPRHRPV